MSDKAPPIAIGRRWKFEVIGVFEGKGQAITARRWPCSFWARAGGRPRGGSLEHSAGAWSVGAYLSRGNGLPADPRPQAPAYGYRWRREPSVTEEFRVPHDIFDSTDYRDSPIRAVIEGGGRVRYRLDDEASIQAFPLLQSLRQAGGTDYLAVSLSCFQGRHQVSTWSSDRVGASAPVSSTRSPGCCRF